MNNERNKYTKSGVTLLSLVVTVIILIILAGVTINLTIGEQGIFKHGQDAKVKQQISQYIDEIELARGETTLDKKRRPTLDELIEKIKQNNVIPGGRITKLDEEKAQAVTKEGYVIIITEDGTKYDRTEKVEDIPELKEGDIVISIQPEDEWTNKDVTVKIESNVKGNYILKYSFDAENWKTYTQEFKVSKNTNVYTCLENVLGEQGNHTSVEIKKIDKLKPIDFTPIITNTTNTIKIDAAGAQDEGATTEYAQSGIGEIWYKCYKKGTIGEWKTNEDKTKTDYTFTGLEDNEAYIVEVKVIDNAKNEITTQLQEINTDEMQTAQGNITIKSPTWDASTNKASVTIEKGSSIASTLQIQYQVNGDDEDSWTIGTSVGNLNHGDVVNARLWDGNNGGSYTSLTVVDGTKPTVNVSITSKGTNTMSASVTASDSQWGMETNPTYTFYIKKTSEADTAYEKKQSSTSTTCSFSGLEQTTSYTVKVEVKDKAQNTGTGTASDTTQAVTVAEGNITIKSPTWDASTHKASVTIEKGSSVASTLQIQYQVNTDNENGWTTGTSVGNLNHGDVVNARLWDGNNGGSYTSLTVVDSTVPNAPTITFVSGTAGSNGYYKSNVVLKITEGSDNQSGVQKVTYVLSGATTKTETTITSGNNITISANGSTTVTAYTYDKANNKSAEATYVVKIDAAVPGNASITISGTKTQSSLPVTLKAKVTHSDAISGITISSCKYVLSTASGNIGTNPNNYTGGTFSSNGQEITIRPSSATKWYLHVLTIDSAGNAKETVKGPITVTAKYHSHTGSSSAGGGCYTKAVYHAHNTNCYCQGRYMYNGVYVGNCNFDDDTIYPITCELCGLYQQWYGRDMDRYGAYLPCGRNLCYKSNSSVDSYSLNCGKTGITIENYTITY